MPVSQPPRDESPPQHAAPRNAPAEPRAIWAKPELRVLGDLRELTMGTTLLIGESGQPLTHRP